MFLGPNPQLHFDVLEAMWATQSLAGQQVMVPFVVSLEHLPSSSANIVLQKCLVFKSFRGIERYHTTTTYSKIRPNHLESFSNCDLTRFSSVFLFTVNAFVVVHVFILIVSPLHCVKNYPFTFNSNLINKRQFTLEGKHWRISTLMSVFSVFIFHKSQFVGPTSTCVCCGAPSGSA